MNFHFIDELWKYWDNYGEVVIFKLELTRITQVWALMGSLWFCPHFWPSPSPRNYDHWFKDWDGFGVYLRVFGAIWSSSDSPSTTRGTLCIGYVDSSTWYPSYTMHVGISIPMVATHWLCLFYRFLFVGFLVLFGFYQVYLHLLRWILC